MKKKQTEYVESVHEQDYDRWGDFPGLKLVLDPPKKTQKNGTKKAKSKKND